MALQHHEALRTGAAAAAMGEPTPGLGMLTGQCLRDLHDPALRPSAVDVLAETLVIMPVSPDANAGLGAEPDPFLLFVDQPIGRAPISGTIIA